MDDPELLSLLFVVAVILMSVTFFGGRFALRRRGSVDFDRWRALADSRGWTFTSTRDSSRVVARVHGAMVIANAVGTLVGRARSYHGITIGGPRDRDNDALAVATSIIAPITGAPTGFSLRQRSLTDAVTETVGAASVPIDDEALAAAVVVTGDEQPTQALLAKPAVRDAILGLTGYGTLSISPDMIQLSTGDLLGPIDLEMLIERIAALAAEIGVPESATRPPPAPTAAAIRRPRLGSLVQRVASTATTKFGRDAADDLTGRPVVCEMELETLHLRHGLADGSQGVMLLGVEVRGTTRIEMSAKVSVEEIRQMMPGSRITADALLERYDGVRDRAELAAEGPLTIVVEAEPNAKQQRDATFARLADDIAVKTDLGAVVEVLYVGAATRARLLVHMASRVYEGDFIAIKENPLRDGFVPPAARGGASFSGLVGKREVEVLVPPGSPEPNGHIRASVVRWDEFAGRPVLLTTP